MSTIDEFVLRNKINNLEDRIKSLERSLSRVSVGVGGITTTNIITPSRPAPVTTWIYNTEPFTFLKLQVNTNQFTEFDKMGFIDFGAESQQNQASIFARRSSGGGDAADLRSDIIFMIIPQSSITPESRFEIRADKETHVIGDFIVDSDKAGGVMVWFKDNGTERFNFERDGDVVINGDQDGGIQLAQFNINAGLSAFSEFAAISATTPAGVYCSIGSSIAGYTAGATYMGDFNWLNSKLKDLHINAWGATDIYEIQFHTGDDDNDADLIKRAGIDKDGLIMENGTRINEFSTDGTLGGDSDLAVPTEKAVKTYAAPLLMARIGSPTFTTVQHMQDIFHSSGWTSGGVLSDAGSGNLDVAAGTGLIRATDSSTVQLLFFDWSASNGNAIPADTTRYVGVEYNAGSPQVVIKSADTWDNTTDFILGVVTNEGGTLHITQSNHAVGDHARFMIERLHEVNGLQRASGVILGEDGANRNVTVSAGVLWEKLNEISISAIDTSGADTFDIYYRDGIGGHTKVAAQSVYPNTEYDDSSGLLADIGNNKYAAMYFYIELDDELVMVYGTATYNTLAGAQLDPVPTDLPDRLVHHGLLIGRIIIKKSAVSGVVETRFIETFSNTGVTSHLDIADVGSNTHPQIDTYIALNHAEIDQAQNWSANQEFQDDIEAVFGNDADFSIVFDSAANRIEIRDGATARFSITATGLIVLNGSTLPATANARDLGSTALEWRAGYFGQGASSGVHLGLTQEVRLWSDNAASLTKLESSDPITINNKTTLLTASDTDNIAVEDNSAIADYGAAWATVNLPSAPGEGMTVHRWNSNGGVAAGRTYTYLNGAWRYVDLL